MENLDFELLALKRAAKPKRWHEPPDSCIVCAGWVLTCAIENGRLVLGVSVSDKARVSVTELLNAVIKVFGEPQATIQATYPMRGPTTLFQWGQITEWDTRKSGADP